MHPIQVVHLLTHLGPGWCLFRMRYMLRLWLGLLERRTPGAPWSEFANEYAEGLFPSSNTEAVLPSDDAVVAEADAVETGVFRLYSAHDLKCGFPPLWNTDPFTGREVPADRHWSRISDFAGGDIKDLWELSRFPWAFSLVRAYARDGKVSRPDAFWRLFESWQAANPPNLGPQWKCGQEATFRLMAAALARYAFSGCAATTPSRLAAWRAFVLATGQRVAANLDYALSQSNNHGVSECVGLVTAALLLPGAPESPGWLRRGLESLRRQLGVLVYSDGSFSQHSVNYHRVMLQDLCWVAALLRANNHVVPTWLVRAGLRATDWLAAIVDPVSGHAPCSGSNDGAHILPLAPGGYADFRPTLVIAHAIFRGELPAEPGPADESIAWLASNTGARESTAGKSTDLHARDGGWHILRRMDSWLLLRAPEKFRDRPSSADMLHVDLWWRGLNIARDPGSYSYNTTGPFESAFKGARVHNTVTFDGREPLKKFGRFLFLPWPKGKVDLSVSGTISATHGGWTGIGATHRRTVSFSTGVWRIEDRLVSKSLRSARLHWLFGDVPHAFDAAGSSLRLRTSVGEVTVRWQIPGGPVNASLVRADAQSDRGWISPFYRCVEPALSLALESQVAGEAVWITEFELSSTEAPRS
jgi:hypothetical protein